MFACAAFSKESRMKFANANKMDRKSGGSPRLLFTRVWKKHWKKVVFGPGTL
jgi:hypothetical protein